MNRPGRFCWWRKQVLSTLTPQSGWVQWTTGRFEGILGPCSRQHHLNGWHHTAFISATILTGNTKILDVPFWSYFSWKKKIVSHISMGISHQVQTVSCDWAIPSECGCLSLHADWHPGQCTCVCVCVCVCVCLCVCVVTWSWQVSSWLLLRRKKSVNVTKRALLGIS